MITVKLAGAKARLSEIPDKVESGQDVVITRRGKAVAHVFAVVRPKNPLPLGDLAGRVSGSHASLSASRCRDDLAVSQWTQVEFASLLSREVRIGDLDSAAAHEAGSRFESTIEESFVVLLPDRNDFARTKGWINRFETGLRARKNLNLQPSDYETTRCRS